MIMVVLHRVGEILLVALGRLLLVMSLGLLQRLLRLLGWLS